MRRAKSKAQSKKIRGKVPATIQIVAKPMDGFLIRDGKRVFVGFTHETPEEAASRERSEFVVLPGRVGRPKTEDRRVAISVTLPSLQVAWLDNATVSRSKAVEAAVVLAMAKV